MAYHYSRVIRLPFEDAVQRVTVALEEKGFTVISAIDLSDLLRTKLDHEFRNYYLISGCIPESIYKAVTLESHIGLLVPCNVLIQEHESGSVEISAVNPMETMERNAPVGLIGLAEEISRRLRGAMDNLHHEQLSEVEALPGSAAFSGNITPIPG